MKKIYLLLFMLSACLFAGAEQKPGASKAVLKGRVTDGVDNSALRGVSVYFPDLKNGTETDKNGEYVMENLPACKVLVQITYVGHQTIVQTVDLGNVGSLNFVMKESNALLNEVVVTGLAGTELRRNSPSPVSVVTERELKAGASTNIIDAIAKQPGVAQITTGCGISKPVIRGLGYNRIVVVNDGVRQEGQQWGDEHKIEIDPQTIHSVEILKGPASLMYGSDAMAGVLIFHEAPTMQAGKMAVNAGSEYQTNNGLFDYTLNFAGNKGGVVWNWRYSDKMAHAYKNKYDGYVLNSQFRERAASGMLGINKNWGYSHLTLDYYHLTPGIVEGERNGETGEFTLPDGSTASRDELKTYGKALPFQQIHHYKAVWNNSILVGSGSIKAILGYQQNRRQEFEESFDECGLDFVLHTINYDVHYLSSEFGGWKVVAGTNGMYQRSLNKGDEFLIPSYHLFDFGLFATASRSFDRLHLSGGLRFDNRHVHSEPLEEEGTERFSKLSRNFSGVTGSCGATYNATDNLNLRINISRGFRAPNMSELASNGVHEGTFRYETGNESLKPEFCWQLDLGLDYSSAVLSAQLSLFANKIDNYIFARKTADGKDYDSYQYTSGDARLLGGEASVDFHPIERLHFENSLSYVDAVQLHQPQDTKYLPSTPAPRWTSDLRYDIFRDGKVLNNTFVSVGLENNFRQSHYYKADGTETATPSYMLLNLSLGTDIKSHGHRIATLKLIGENLADKAYQSHLSRLKYADINQASNRPGVYNMGRNFCIKVEVPIVF